MAAPLLNLAIRALTGGAALTLGDWIYQQVNENGGEEAPAGAPPQTPAPAPTAPAAGGDRSRSNPLTGAPGSVSGTTTKDGDKKQDRLYGDDGYPVKDTDYDHFHDGEKPHVHDWTRPGDGSPPTSDDRQPGRKPRPEEIGGSD
jgi:hypothetical protein